MVVDAGSRDQRLRAIRPDRVGSSVGRVTPVSLPDLSSLEGWVQDKALERYATVRDLESHVSKASDIESANAYGSLGLVLMAAEQYDGAAASPLDL